MSHGIFETGDFAISLTRGETKMSVDFMVKAQRAQRAHATKLVGVTERRKGVTIYILRHAHDTEILEFHGDKFVGRQYIGIKRLSPDQIITDFIERGYAIKGSK